MYIFVRRRSWSRVAGKISTYWTLPWLRGYLPPFRETSEVSFKITMWNQFSIYLKLNEVFPERMQNSTPTQAPYIVLTKKAKHGLCILPNII